MAPGTLRRMVKVQLQPTPCVGVGVASMIWWSLFAAIASCVFGGYNERIKKVGFHHPFWWAIGGGYVEGGNRVSWPSDHWSLGGGGGRVVGGWLGSGPVGGPTPIVNVTFPFQWVELGQSEPRNDPWPRNGFVRVAKLDVG